MVGGGFFGPRPDSNCNNFLTMNLWAWNFENIPNFYIGYFWQKKPFPKRPPFWVMTSPFFFGENFHFLQFFPFVIYCFLYLSYTLMFIVIRCFLTLKLKLLTSSYFEKLWKKWKIKISWFHFGDCWSHQSFWWRHHFWNMWSSYFHYL